MIIKDIYNNYRKKFIFKKFPRAGNLVIQVKPSDHVLTKSKTKPPLLDSRTTLTHGFSPHGNTTCGYILKLKFGPTIVLLE